MPKGLCCIHRPVRVAQDFAAEKYHVGLPSADNVIGLRWRGDETNGSGGDAGLLPYSRGELGLEAGTSSDLRSWHETGGGDVHEIDTQAPQRAT